MSGTNRFHNGSLPESPPLISFPSTLSAMLHASLIYVPVWLALAGWFAGSIARVRSNGNAASSADVVYRFAWLFGATMIVLHILTSYGIAHDWSHTAAVQATAEESEQVTGIRAGWGVYVNFAFTAIWLGYSVAMVFGRRRWLGIDPLVFWFTVAIVFSATVVFEAGAIRWLSATGFVALAVSWVWSWRPVDSDRSILKAIEDDEQ